MIADMTPLRVTVEIDAKGERVWRLSDGIAVGAIRFAREVPFDRGTQVRLRFELTRGAVVETQGTLADERTIALDAAPPERRAIMAYLEQRGGSA